MFYETHTPHHLYIYILPSPNAVNLVTQSIQGRIQQGELTEYFVLVFADGGYKARDWQVLPPAQEIRALPTT